MARSNLFITYFSPVSCYFFLNSNTTLTTFSSNPLNLHIFPRLKDQVSHPHNTYISISLRSHHDMLMQAQRGGGGMAPTHSQLSIRRRWVVSTTLRNLYPRKRLGTDCKRGWVGPRGGLKVTEVPTPPGFFPGGVRSESLYGLRYLGSTNILTRNSK